MLNAIQQAMPALMGRAVVTGHDPVLLRAVKWRQRFFESFTAPVALRMLLLQKFSKAVIAMLGSWA